MLHSFFFDSAASRPHRTALWVDERLYEYGQLATRSREIAAALRAVDAAHDVRRCVLFAYRSFAAYVGLLGVLDAGMAYVPVSPRMPPARIATIIAQSGARVMLVDGRCAALLEEVLPLLDEPPLLFALDDDAAIHMPRLPWPVETPARRSSSPGDLAYVLFTSGSTGTPKGVPISHANACAYVAGQLQYNDDASPDARYIQFCDLTFDPSIHDMFVCWANGACLYVPQTVEPLHNAAFIQTHAITHWNSVPSVAGFMQQFRKLGPNEFPSLRWTAFGGEALPRSLVLAWMSAAPNSRVVNLYGPTEATVCCTRFEVTRDYVDDIGRAVMPIGRAVPGTEVLVVDMNLQPVAEGETGELLIGGPQVSSGYCSASDVERCRFLSRRYAGFSSTHWYRSGDAVCESVEHGLQFRGRLDTQVKVRGNRVELEEVEHAVRRSSHATLCAVIAWPVDETGRPAGIVAFVQDARVGISEIVHACKQQLPVYAVPNRVIHVDALPLNANGKIDRKALAGLCTRSETVVKT